MITNIKPFFLCILSTTSINPNAATIEFDHALLSSNGTLTAKTLPIFLTQAYGENKIYNKDFHNTENLNIHKLPVFTTFYTLQIFLVTSTHFTSAYIIKETKNGITEAQHLQMLENYPGIKELTTPSIPPRGLPSLAIPFAYLSYCNQKKQTHYITIMPVAKGVALGALIAQFRDDQSPCNTAKIELAYSQLGYELGSFHKRFMTSSNELKISRTISHGDFHCSNIFYDEIENHCTFIDNETIALSLEHPTDPSQDIIKLFLDFFSIQANSRKNMIKGIDLALWHTIALKNFIKGYIRVYQPHEQMQVLQELKAMFNTDYNFSWFRFKPLLLERLRNNYINPIFDDIEKILWHRDHSAK